VRIFRGLFNIFWNWMMISRRNHLENSTYQTFFFVMYFQLSVYYYHTYTAGWNVWGEWCLAGTQGNHQNFDPSLLTNKLRLVFMEMKQNNFFFLKKKFKMADWKKGHFSKSPILDISLWKFNGLVLGLVGLNDAKGIDLAQPIWSSGCPT